MFLPLTVITSPPRTESFLRASVENVLIRCGSRRPGGNQLHCLRLGDPLRWKTRSALVVQRDEAFNGSKFEPISSRRLSPFLSDVSRPLLTQRGVVGYLELWHSFYFEGQHSRFPVWAAAICWGPEQSAVCSRSLRLDSPQRAGRVETAWMMTLVY